MVPEGLEVEPQGDELLPGKMEISALPGRGVGAGSSPAPPPSPMRKAGRCFVELQEQPLPRTPSLLKEGEPRQRAQNLPRRFPATQGISQ